MSYSYLVGEGVTKVVRGGAATWQAGVKDDDAIVCRGAGIARREGCICEEFNSV